MDYQEPSWAVPPPKDANWALLEIKGGVPVATHSLHKKCILLGRAATSPHISLHHESSSRLHARIAFDSHGTPWLRDLSSTHGTTVNRRRLPSAAIGKVESTSSKSGSRGIVLYPGDLLQFGASTRMFCLEGPPEYERGATIHKKLPQTTSETDVSAVSNTKSNVQPTTETEDDTGVSWGMVDSVQNTINDSVHQDHVQHSIQAYLDDPSRIPDKHRPLYERIMAKRYKLQNVQRESERIQNKGELSQGQEAQLRKNEERIRQWEQELQELEHELDKKLHPDKNNKPSHSLARVQEQDDQNEDDDFDFYDRTKKNDDKFFQDGETQESLVAKWKELLEEWKQCSKSLLDVRQKVNKLQSRVETSDPNDEDTFFLQNDLDIQKDSLQKEEERKQEILNHLQETERLLQVVNASLEFDRETGFIGDPTKPREKEVSKAPSTASDDDAAIMPPPVDPASPVAPPRTLSPAASMLPPPAQMPPPLEISPPASMLPPPPKRARVLGPTMPPPSTTLAVDEMEMPPPQFSRPPPPTRAPIGTLSVLAASSSSKRDGKEKQKKSANNHASEDSSFDPKKDVWKAPEGQDGSGMTKLNAKFAGRY